MYDFFFCVLHDLSPPDLLRPTISPPDLGICPADLDAFPSNGYGQIRRPNGMAEKCPLDGKQLAGEIVRRGNDRAEIIQAELRRVIDIR